MNTFRQAILELEKLKINAPIYGQNNYTFRFAYQNLLQEMYSRDLSKNFIDPQYIYSNNIVNNIISRINDTTKTFVFNDDSELLYLQALPQESQKYILLLNNIVLNKYVFNDNDESNIKYYYVMLKFIPIYFELTLGIFKTAYNVRDKHITSLNNIMDKKIILGLEDYTTYNFLIKEISKTKLINPFIKIVESINNDPNMILVPQHFVKPILKKPVIIKNHSNDLELYTVLALKKKCVEYGLPQSGLKQDIIKRLIDFSKDNKCLRCLDNHKELIINCIHICKECALVLKECPKCLKKY